MTMFRVFARHRLMPTPVIRECATEAAANAFAAGLINHMLHAEGLPDTARPETWRDALATLASIYQGRPASEVPTVCVVVAHPP